MPENQRSTSKRSANQQNKDQEEMKSWGVIPSMMALSSDISRPPPASIMNRTITIKYDALKFQN